MPAGRSRVVGLTGGIGTGKSRVLELLRALGAAVECSDVIVREIQAPGGRALGAIADTFGAEYLTADGALDRPKLGQLVFADPTARRKLNDIIHPLVYLELTDRLKKHAQAGAPVIVLDIPLLLEGRRAGRGSGAGIPFDEVVVVYADEAAQISRVMARDKLSRADAEARVRAQMPIEEKRAMADTVIDNSGAWDATERTTRELWARWARERADTARA
jgi:dephospho-CoA kinase